MNDCFITVVSPVYKADTIVPELVRRIETSLLSISDNFEIILIDDGSPDNSWQVIKELCNNNSRIVGIKLSRNFGQHYAISAGLSRVKGEWIIVMDCDLQDQPEEIEKMLNAAMSGYDVVLACRTNRQDSWLKKLSSRLFYKLLSYLTGLDQDETVANFGLYNKKVIHTITSMPETIRYFPAMVRWVGFRATKVDVEHAERANGKSSYNFTRSLNLALDICLAYSDKPLRLVVKLGLILSFVGLLYALFVLMRFLAGDIQVLGYTSVIASIWILSGIILIVLGIMGLYVGKIFEGVKRRPIFVVDEICNHHE